jgi:hypothetical protein
MADIELVCLSVISESTRGVTVGELSESFQQGMEIVVGNLHYRGDLVRYEGGIYVLSPQGKRRLRAAERILS